MASRSATMASGAHSVNEVDRHVGAQRCRNRSTWAALREDEVADHELVAGLEEYVGQRATADVAEPLVHPRRAGALPGSV